MFKDHVEVPGLDKEKSKLDDLINQMRYFKDFIKKLNRMDVTSNRSQHQIKNGDIVLTYLGMLCTGRILRCSLQTKYNRQLLQMVLFR